MLGLKRCLSSYIRQKAKIGLEMPKLSIWPQTYITSGDFSAWAAGGCVVPCGGRDLEEEPREGHGDEGGGQQVLQGGRQIMIIRYVQCTRESLANPDHRQIRTIFMANFLNTVGMFGIKIAIIH